MRACIIASSIPALPACRRDEPLPLRPRDGPRLFLPADAERPLHGDLSGRISGPLLDRFDLAIEVPAVSAADLILPPPREGSAEVAARVLAAREIQAARYAAIGLPHVLCNAAAPPNVIETVAELDPSGATLLREAAERMRLTARGFHRVLKLARTLADLDASLKVSRAHLAEALSYRARGPMQQAA